MTKCPPISSPTLNALSKFTRLPIFQSERFVLFIVSLLISNVKTLSFFSVKVKQTPEQAIEQPILIRLFDFSKSSK